MFNILIVEDQSAVREIISEVILTLEIDINIVEAINLEEANQNLVEQKWDLMIADLSLGDGYSLDLVSKLHTQGVSVPPVILASGFLSSEHMEQAKLLNIKYILEKPFELKVLLEHIQSILLIDQHGQDVQKYKSSQHLLPEVFKMDRKLGLLFRMFDELPKQKDVTSVCQTALKLAMDIMHSEGGYIALFERHKEQLVRIADHELGSGILGGTCSLHDTPFAPLIYDSEEIIEVQGTQRACWPKVPPQAYIGVPIYLQGVAMGVLCLTRKGESAETASDSLHILRLLLKKLDTLLDNRAVHAALAESMNETLIALVRSLEARDRYTKDHSSRVSQLSVLFAESLGLDEQSIQLIRTGGLLHDIGKVGIADSVLLKPGRYTDQEYAIMKAHPAIGDAILNNMDTLARERLIVRHHHERWDGKGYPDKIGGTEIPFEARIVCVADAIDAMTTHRVYRQAKPLSFCAEQLEFASGTQFDPEVVKVALAAIKHGQVDTQAKFNNYDEGVLPIQAVLAQDLRSKAIL